MNTVGVNKAVTLLGTPVHTHACMHAHW